MPFMVMAVPGHLAVGVPFLHNAFVHIAFELIKKHWSARFEPAALLALLPAVYKLPYCFDLAVGMPTPVYAFGLTLPKRTHKCGVFRRVKRVLPTAKQRIVKPGTARALLPTDGIRIKKINKKTCSTLQLFLNL